MTIEELLELNGFVFERKNKHVIWKDVPTGKIFVYSATPSDWRVDMKRIKDLRKLVRSLGREFLTGEEKVKERFLHRPFEVLKKENVPEVSKQEETPSERPIRPLDAAGIEIIRQRAEAMVSQSKIAEELNQIGYTRNSGGMFTQSEISVVMKKNKIVSKHTSNWHSSKKSPAKNKIKKHRKEEDVVTEVAIKGTTKKKVKSGWIGSVEEIVTSNLAAHLKEKFILEIVKEAMG